MLFHWFPLFRCQVFPFFSVVSLSLSRRTHYALFRRNSAMCWLLLAAASTNLSHFWRGFNSFRFAIAHGRVVSCGCNSKCVNCECCILSLWCVFFASSACHRLNCFTLCSRHFFIRYILSVKCCWWLWNGSRIEMPMETPWGHKIYRKNASVR